MTSFIRKLNQNKIFRFVASIRLAVPLLLIMAATVAWGTIIESRYNADMAKIVVYDSWWFLVLLGLLWLNIFCSTLSRLPWKFHHLGFVVTHLGLLTLLGGAFVTSKYGVDGQMRIPEGQASDQIALSRLVFGFGPANSPNLQMVDIARSTKPSRDLSAVNDEFGAFVKVDRYEPFVEVQNGYREGGTTNDVALSFILKSPFFNVSEFLHSKQNPTMQLGPARLQLVVDDKTAAEPPPKPAARRAVANAEVKPAKADGSAYLEIQDANSSASLKRIAMKDLMAKKTIDFRNIKIVLKRQFRHAIVAQGGVQEGDSSGAPNPAVELQIVSADGKTRREVLYAKYPGFSISKEPLHDFKLIYHLPEIAAAETEAAPAGHGAMAAAAPDQQIETHTNKEGGGAPAMGTTDNTIRFRVNPGRPHEAKLELEKGGKVVMSQTIHEGESITTPWMGIQITMASLIFGAEPQNDIHPIEPVPREQLPQGAVHVSLVGTNEAFWLPEDDFRNVTINGRDYVVYFGARVEHLPFRLELEKFYKKDYPGTETAMSYESDVKLPGDIGPRKISMNEPLKTEGFTIYQSSYQVSPGQPAISIFSVNRDPGRPFKYLGSLILCLGIILFTVMRSGAYRKFMAGRNATA